MDIIKICTKCGQANPHRRRKDRGENSTISWCRECERVSFSTYYNSLKRMYMDILGGKCQGCGIVDHPCIYDFHHNDPHSKTNVIQRIPKHQQIDELKKCSLLCGKCHRKEKYSKIAFAGPNDVWKECAKCKQLQPHRLKQHSERVNKSAYHSYLCRRCEDEQNLDRQLLVKQKAVEMMGGKCIICGLVDDPSVYDFHHRDPNEKEFKISRYRSFASITKELEKCVLLCCHCHRKLHAGVLDPLTF